MAVVICVSSPRVEGTSAPVPITSTSPPMENTVSPTALPARLFLYSFDSLFMLGSLLFSIYRCIYCFDSV